MAKKKLKQKLELKFCTKIEQTKAFQKARIELLNNIPLKGDSKKTMAKKKKKYNDLTKRIAKFNNLCY